MRIRRAVRRCAAVALVLCFAPPAGAQPIRIGLGGAIARGNQGTGGSTLTLPESANLNRILAKATDYFAQTPPRWEEGVRVIQELLEGNALEVGPDHLDDPFYSVYSDDQRLFIPFSRYCQKLVCELDPEGLETYRLLMDPRAGDLLRRAGVDQDPGLLAEISERFFATRHGPTGTAMLADLHELRGEVSRSVHLRARLLADYPDLEDSLWRQLWLRQAHAYALLGEEAKLRAAFDALADRDPKASYRVGEENVLLSALPDHPAFRVRSEGVGSTRDDERELVGKGLGDAELEALWRFSFSDSDPYRLRRKKNQNQGMVFFGNMGSSIVPDKKSFRPGLTVKAVAGSNNAHRLVLKDHDRLVMLDFLSGKLLARDDAARDKERGGANRPMRIRLPATDFGLQQVRYEAGRLYCTSNNRVSTGGSTSDAFPYRNQIYCFDPADGRKIWESEKLDKNRRVFFQTPPIAYDGKLYAPVRKGKFFCLARLDAKTGKVESVVTIHAGGTRYLRVPAVPPVRVGNLLLQLTNAGAVAAFSLPDLKLQWLRRYEKRTPHQPAPRPIRSSGTRFYGNVQARALKRWKPSEPIVHRGRIVIAPIDSDAFLCLDIQSGEVAWVLPRGSTRPRDRGVEFNEVVGLDGNRLFLAGNHLQCVDLPSGKRLWEKRLPERKGGYRSGHGCVAAGQVWLPSTDGVLRFDASDGRLTTRYALPPPIEGEASADHPLRLQLIGPLLFAISETQVVAYSTAPDLIASSAHGLARAKLLAAGGKLRGSWELLGDLLRKPDLLSDDEREEIARTYVRYAGELAKRAGGQGGKEEALVFIDETESRLSAAKLPADPRLLLFRIDSHDPKADAAKIRELRDELSGLDLGENKKEAR